MNPKLQAIVLECPAETRQLTETRDLFWKIFNLKMDGYIEEYGPDILPVGRDDFVGTHIAICEQTPGGLVPAIAYKSITLERCLRHQFEFPAVTLARAVGARDHLRFLEKVIAECQQTGSGLVYGGSMTIRPDLRTNREFVGMLWEAMIAMSLFYDQSCSISRAICYGACKFKMHRIFNRMGYLEPELDGKQLGPIPLAFDLESKSALFYRLKPSSEALFLMRRYEWLWQSRHELKARSAVREAA